MQYHNWIIAIMISSILESTTATKPHIIFILLDDVGYNDVGWHNEEIHTPFLNKLAREGVTLESYYTYFVCTPSRASLLTGYYSDKLGMQGGVLSSTQPYGIPLQFKLISDRLKDVGYSSHMIGKWHVGFCDWKYTPTYRGFDSFFGFYNGAEENYKHCTSYLFNNSQGNCVGFDFRSNARIAHEYDGQYSSEIYTQYATNKIDSWKKTDKPMFLYISYVDTHFPLQPPKRYTDMCGKNVNDARHQFCGAMAAIDEGVNNITTALKNKGIYDNTVIIFASDNGGAIQFGGSNYPLRGEKTSIFEGGTRVPAFVHSPLLHKKQYVNTRIIHVADWYPTILHLAGAKPVLGIDGINQWFTISTNCVSSRKYLPYHMEVYKDDTYTAAIRDDQYKLIAGSGGISNAITPECETIDCSYNMSCFMWYVNRSRQYFDRTDSSLKLYDLQKDPSEKYNIAAKMPSKVIELAFQLKKLKTKSKPYANLDPDPKGDPANFNNTFVPGWCKAYDFTPDNRRNVFI